MTGPKKPSNWSLYVASAQRYLVAVQAGDLGECHEAAVDCGHYAELTSCGRLAQEWLRVSAYWARVSSDRWAEAHPEEMARIQEELPVSPEAQARWNEVHERNRAAAKRILARLEAGR